ncbi:MAG: GyrI-like domain-containing protein [Pseudomonadota bacterium]
MCPVEIEDHPARHVAAVAHRGAYPEIRDAFERLTAVATERALWPISLGIVGVYHDDPDVVAEADLRSHAGLILPEDAAIPVPLEALMLPGGPHAVMRYKGPYTGLGAAYASLFGSWLPVSGREMADGPSFDLYLNSPLDTPPEELLTHICVPLRSASGT